MNSRTRILQFASLSFDAATAEIFPALAGGAALVLSAREDIIPGRALAAFLAHRRITMLCLPPSLLATMGSAQDDLGCLDTLLVAGEACPLALARTWATPGRRFFNAYGPTEATVCATVYEFHGGEEFVPIGRPLPGVTVHLVTEPASGPLQEVPAGQPGELCIGGVGVARGYRGKPELTAALFVRSPWEPGLLYRTGDLAVRHLETGLLEFIGRKDNQIKIRGFRIELEAIERILCTHPGVQLAAVAVHELAGTHADCAKSLVGYIVARPDADPEALSPEALHRFVSERLPDYMTPPMYVQLDKLPMVANGSKVDRAALPALYTKRNRPSKPTQLTQPLATLFDEALSLPIGTFQADSHFFEMGGHSLGVAHLVLALKTNYGIRVPTRLIYQYPTPGSLASLVEQLLGSAGNATGTEAVNLRAEAVLEQDIRPTGPTAAPPSHGAVLLTGATGFLGSFLLYELLRQDPELQISCLVRGPSIAVATERLRSTLEKNGLDPELVRRVRILVGDLEDRALGLSATEYAELAASIHSIYHCAADINYVKPYAKMKGPNVEGTKNVLRLACSGPPKAVHYASSVGVFGACRGLLGVDFVDESYDLDRSANILACENGYIKSKWVAERLVRTAGERGLRVSIFRPGFIEGNSQTGIANVTDLLCRMIVGCVQLGVYPRFAEKLWLPVPVDFVAAAMAHIALSGQRGSFHLILDRDREVGHVEMFRIISELGYPMTALTPHEWFGRLAACGPDNALYPIMPYLLERVYEGRNSILEVHYSTPSTANATTHQALAGSSITVPAFDRTLLATYLNYFVSCGLLPPPMEVTT